MSVTSTVGRVQPVANAGDHLGGQHGITTEGEEVVVDPDLVDGHTEHVGDDRDQRRFQRR